MEMEKKIAKEISGRDKSKITELNLDKCKSTSVIGLSAEWEKLETLSMNEVGLTMLKGFPRLPNLKMLDLSDNHLSSDLDALTCLPKLTQLNLSGNKIKDMEALEPLKNITTLKSLDLSECEICNAEGYRDKVFQMLSSLVYLDGFDKEDNSEVEDEEDEEEEEEIDGEEEEDVPLEAIYKDYNPEGDKDYEAVDDEEEDIEEEEDDDSDKRGEKRKHEGDE